MPHYAMALHSRSFGKPRIGTFKFEKQKITHEVSEAVERFERNNPHHAMRSNVTQMFFQNDELVAYAGDAARRIV